MAPSLPPLPHQRLPGVQSCAGLRRWASIRIFQPSKGATLPRILRQCKPMFTHLQGPLHNHPFPSDQICLREGRRRPWIKIRDGLGDFSLSETTALVCAMPAIASTERTPLRNRRSSGSAYPDAAAHFRVARMSAIWSRGQRPSADVAGDPHDDLRGIHGARAASTWPWACHAAYHR